MRAEELSSGLAITLENFVREMDLCPKYVWDIENEVTTPDHYEATINWTPMDQVWVDYGLTEDARIFWEQSNPAMAKAYAPSFRVELPKLRWRGGAKTVKRVTRS